LWLNRAALWPLARRLRQAGFSVYPFSYPSVHLDLHGNAARLAAFVRGIDAGTVHLVGHSLGGVVIRALLNDFPDLAPGRVVTLGSPHGGSIVGRQRARSRLWRLLLGRAVAQLNAGEPARWPVPPREIGTVSGTHSFGAARLVYRSLPRPNDGLLTVAETQWQGARDAITLPVSHTGMLLSARVADAVAAFLRHGSFATHPS
jgi:pimeloyl-ACP methyl ester carboxylesterase